MKRKTRVPLLCLSLLCLTLCAAMPPVLAETPLAESPLEELGALAVGDWRGDDSRHVLEWGVGRRALRSKSYQASENGWTLVGEGLWFWDPAQDAIRGVAVAIEMPVELFKYRSQVHGTEVVHRLIAEGPAGGEYVERWVFDGDSYRWTLETGIEDDREVLMGGAYRRAGSEE